MINSDKTITGLFRDYEKLFAGIMHRKIKYLEIGIAEGGSLEWAKNYFDRGDIFGIDIDLPEVEIPGVTMAKINQNDSTGLFNFARKYGKFDVIIDDASHFKEETENTFMIFNLFLKPGGFYIIEDWAAEHLPNMDVCAGMQKLVGDLVWSHGGAMFKNKSGGTFAVIGNQLIL